MKLIAQLTIFFIVIVNLTSALYPIYTYPITQCDYCPNPCQPCICGYPLPPVEPLPVEPIPVEPSPVEPSPVEALPATQIKRRIQCLCPAVLCVACECPAVE